ncbi:MAG: RNA methyltransferase [Clostridia bacterium]|nr:RNA methyltransferase [Clostridia bacterium]
METITSKTNDKIKYASQLASASKRRECGEFLLEGARLCSDAAESGIGIVRAFFTGEALKKYSGYTDRITEVCDECYEISSAAAEKLSDTGNTQGVFCVCRIRENSASPLKERGRYIMLENVQDPSNLGAIFRTSEALGIDAVIINGGCDIYNPKALRAAMGSSLRIDLIRAEDAVSFIESGKKDGVCFLACVPSETACEIPAAVSSHAQGALVCVLGNEGSGLSEAVISACDERVTIPMKGRAESLNVSAAAAIAAWELIR